MSGPTPIYFSSTTSGGRPPSPGWRRLTFSPPASFWGNPLITWARRSAPIFGWWVQRLRAALSVVDLVRLDHFRGFDAYWEVPAGQPTAEVGRWVKAPGAELLEHLRQQLGGLPLIAEDLGVITPEVEALRD